ncbi:hypothetical protein Lfu02_33630 [Longispora fulva]|uniref:Uncharacterized protein n=1 Tax=Longispora fulva TaxID=619741 RepID=A0A8J7H546_9ACTN|nr:hypothetical protein [Longispora fulva]MBG6141853.1 hypothetical protein [Longispora fulva]GIG58991.1 hypothetical protein Lfu02_33630 [Longispora fulva]
MRQSTGTIGTAQAAFNDYAADPRYRAHQAWISIEPLTRRPRWVLEALCAGVSRPLTNRE